MPELPPVITRRRFVKGALTLGGAAALGVTSLGFPDRQAMAQSVTPQPDHRGLFGIAGHAWWLDRNPDAYLAMYRDLGVQGVRIAVDWKRFEPTEGRYDFSMYDRVLPLLNREGQEITGYFVTVPTWATSDPQLASKEQLKSDLPEAREPQLREAIKAAVMRYPFINRWEVWNEPEMWSYLGKNPADYLRILRAFHEESKAVNPNIQVAVATLTGWDYLKHLYDLADSGTKPWDAVTFHPYPEGAGDGLIQLKDVSADDPGTGERTAEIDRIHNGLISMESRNIPVWITEYGWDRPAIVQARLLANMMKWMATRPWIERAHLHMLHDTFDEGQYQEYGLTALSDKGDITSKTRFIPKEPFYNAFKTASH